MSPYIVAALIAALAAVVAALIGRRATSETNRIVKGNGKGDVSQMNEQILRIAGRMEDTMCQRLDRMDAFVDRQDKHNERQADKLDRLADRVGRIELSGARSEAKAEAGRRETSRHLSQQDAENG